MSGSQSRYDAELEHFSETLSQAQASNIDSLKNAISAASESSLIGVGSGGSFTVASLLCSLHESYTGRVSRVSTPLEIICNPTLAATSPIFLVSAEGKNPDIIEALRRARRDSSRSVNILTNRADSPLISATSEFPEVNLHVYQLIRKDGYLATNSLLLDAALLARAYSELDEKPIPLPLSLAELAWSGQEPHAWLDAAMPFAAEAVKRRGLILVYSPHLRAVAADLESKLSESALTFCQATDFRSFAHGRHLWLSERPQDCTVLALTDPTLNGLWENIRERIPPSVPTLTLSLPGHTPADLLSGLVAQLHLVSLMAQAAERDIGEPSVASFGRELYYADLVKLIPDEPHEEKLGERSKAEIIGARWPSRVRGSTLRRALRTFQDTLVDRKFRAVVFDYDGTLSISQAADGPPSTVILQHLARLADGGVHIGIASGRGNSLQSILRDQTDLPKGSKLRLGLYNGGWIGGLNDEITTSGESEFLNHVHRIIVGLKSSGVPIDIARLTQPYQISVRFRLGVSAEAMWIIVADALRQAGLEYSSVFRSKHSVDILAKGVSKSHLVAHMVQEFSIDPYEVLTMGDLGAWPGNDSSLLEHRFSLSVDMPSRRLDRGWKLAPQHIRDVDATAWYLERAHLAAHGYFQIMLGRSDPHL